MFAWSSTNPPNVRLGPMGIVVLGGAFGSKGILTGVKGMLGISGAFGSKGSATGVFVNDVSVDDDVARLAGPSFNSAAACAVLANNSAKATDIMVC